MFEHRQLHIVRISAMLVASLGLTFTVGCHRDPNVRKQRYLESGKRYEADGKYKEASIQFANALRIDKYWAPANFEMGKTLVKMNSISGAYALLRQAVDSDQKNIEYRVEFGNLALAVHVFPEAANQAHAILALNPNNADAYVLLAGVAESKNDAAGALKDIQRAIELDPNRSTFHTALGLLEARSPDTENSAAQELTKAASLDPKDAAPHLIMAGLLNKKGDTQGAEQQLTAAISAAPKNLQARATLATLYVQDKEMAKAEQTLIQAVNDLPDEPGAAPLLAEYYEKAGQLDRAPAVFQGLNSKFPKSFPIKLTYARVLFEKKDYAGSTKLADQLTKVDAGNPELQTLNALLLLNTDKPDAAFDLLKKSVKDYPNNLEPQLLLGRVALSKNDLATAESSYQAASKISPGNLDAEAGLADIAIMHNDANSLLGVADKTIQEHPEYPNAYLWRGMAEANRKEFDKAEADFQILLKANPDNAVVYVELAQIRYAQGKTSDGNAMLEKALEKNPNSDVALRMLASYYVVAKQPEKAIARVQAQIAKQPGNAEFYDQLANLQLHIKDAKGALESARKAVQLNPTSSEMANTLTQAEVANGDVDSALSTWQNWTQTHPKDSHAIGMLGSLEQAKGEDQKAIDDYKKALQIDPNDAIASNNLAYLMVEDNQNMDVALSLAQTARRLMPDRPETADTLAWVYYHKENYRAARDLLEQALKTSPDDSSMHLHLGMTYAKLNDKAGAREQLKKSMALAPNDKTGKVAAGELDKLGQ